MVQGNQYKGFSWNITSIVKDWYTTGNNNGLMLKNNNEGAGYSEFFSSDCSLDYQQYRPQVVLTYINNSGLENYWTYHSQNVGRAGTGYSNDYNGNLVFIHDDLSVNGNRMPVSINHVFNSSYKDNNELGYGKGWRLNLNQKLTYTFQNIGGIDYYIYTDEDGTQHYFKYDPNAGVYKDESGLDLTLTKNTDGSFTMKDKGGNQIIFTSYGYLSKIIDTNGNAMSLSYNVSTLKSVTDAAGRTTNLELNSDGSLAAIVDPANRRTTYTYNNSLLEKITYPDGKYTIYHYYSDNNLKEAINYDGYKVVYTYYTASPYRISKILEAHTDGTLGAELSVSYGYNTTTFIKTSDKNKKTTYQFNDSGNTVSIKDDSGYAQYYKYFSGSSKNKLSLESKLQRPVMNYLKNHNAEINNGDWVQDYLSGSVGSWDYTSEEKYFGGQSLKVAKTNNLGRHFYSQLLTLNKGQTYTFSGYVKTSGISNNSGKGSLLFIKYQNSAGVWQLIDSKYINGTNDWDRYEVTFTLPSDALSSNVYACIGIAEETGTAYFDNLQLEDGKIANRYNLIENADFRYGSTLPTFWNKTSTDSSDGLIQMADTGHPQILDNSVFKFTGVTNLSKNIYQDIKVSGKLGDALVIGGWARADSVPLGPLGRYFALDIAIHRINGTTQWVPIQLNEDSTDWQYLSDVVIADNDFSSVTVYALYYNNANTAYFDGMQLYKEEFGKSYQYDSNGNITSTSDLAKQNSTFQYNGSNDLVKAIDPKGNSFSYDYDSKHNLLSASSAENVVYSFTYDSYGNPITAKSGDSALFINSSSEYTIKGNYLKSVTDASGNTVSYNYDEIKGTLSSTVDSKGQSTLYSYDSNTDNLTSVSKEVNKKTVTNNYSYENDRIKTITHSGASYSFEYDSLGNNQAVSVGAQNLIKNVYEPRTGRLLEWDYGNANKVNYSYDDFGRVILEKIDEKDSYKYDYDASGNLGYYEDVKSNVSYRFIYDLSDRLIKIVDSNGNITKYEFDLNNNISKFTEKIDSKNYTTNYEYDMDNRLKKTTINNGSTVQNYYDNIGRKTDSITDTAATQYNTTYNYKDGISGSSTGQVESINNNGLAIKYTYDRNGNIETIRQDADGLLAYYSFNNGDLSDDSGNGNDGTINGNPTFVTGYNGSGKAIQFDGVDDWVELTDFDIPETFSISMWVNPTTTNDGQNFIGKHNSSGGNIFLLGMWNNGIESDVGNQWYACGTKTTGYQHITVTVKKVSSL